MLRRTGANTKEIGSSNEIEKKKLCIFKNNHISSKKISNDSQLWHILEVFVKGNHPESKHCT